MACYTANWDPLGEEAFYRKFELYSMAWNLKEDLQDCLVAAAPYGGPIALLKNNLRREKSPSSRPVLEIYSAAGVPLASVLWKSGQVVQLGWTASEDLLCIQEDGSVLIYNLFCEFQRHFSMGNEVLQNHVREAKVFHTQYGTGVAILTGAHRFSLTTNIIDLKLRRMPEVPGLQKPPSCWAVLSQDRVTLVLLAIGQDLYLLDNTSCSVVTPPGMSPQAGAYLQMAVSFTYRYLALFTDTGYLWMGTASLKEKLGEFSCDIRAPPRQMVWCARPRSKQRAVVVAWDRRLLVAGHSKECIQFVLDEDSYLVPELDGVRIFSRTTHEFLHEIPEASEEIFKIASMAPGALLLEAQREYEKESQKADEYLWEIKDQKLLAEAVRQCIEAACYEHEPETQKSLLRAASFGKCFLDKFPPESFVRTCRDLRVLNAIRDYQIGMPLTFAQYKQLTIEVLLDRLVLRRLYPLAIKICEYLRLSEFQGVSRILAHWACYKVQQKDKSDEEVAQAINQKLGDTPGISYSEIAARAYDCGRTELAIKLLEYEPRSGEQVPLLLKMKKSQLALNKAIESGDTDLAYTVVLHLKNELNRGTFFMTLQKQPVALSLYRQFCKHQELETLKDLYNQDDDHQELGNFHVHSSYSSEKRLEGRLAALQNAVDEYYKAKNEFAAKATEEQIKLLRMQRRLQDDLDKPYVDYSLHDTVYSLILEGSHKRAEQLYREFRIPDKRFWWLKVSALAERADWEELEKFSKSKKSPIGYLPFVEICMKHHSRHEARKYAARVSPEQRVKAHVLVGELDQAADAAIEHKSETEMNLVLSKCTAATDSSIAEKINRAKAQILKK
ncbi:vacuolar protein sorting-associated protein 16 homolog [Carettochelys insculpta]|uniref:vacuolar protein sorting-associated protein 16 homolog n=1 Tax=Carettochelys insculpta TaxID=44489 RepID=UPI003EC02B52